MRALFIISLILLSNIASAQKSKFYYGRDFLEIEGTNYVVSQIYQDYKLFSEGQSFLEFINTENGDVTKVEFSKDASIVDVQQVKIDEKGINTMIILAKTVNLNGNKSIDWTDPTQLYVISIDGNEKVRITEDHFFVKSWVVNQQTGCIVVIGGYDTDKNGKINYKDERGTLIYNLKTMSVVSKKQTS